MDENSIPLSIAKSVAESAGKESINKLADFFGGLFPFFGLRKKGVDAYVQEIQNSNLSPDIKMLTIANTKRTFRELQNQEAIAKIALEVAKDGTDFGETSAVDEEWFDRFMDSAKFVCAEEAQVIWGHVLAGEFEKPNSFPPQTIRILSELPSYYAKVFSNICSLSVELIFADTEGKPKIIFPALVMSNNIDEEYLSSLGINFTSLSELNLLGLLQFEPLAGFVKTLSKRSVPKLHLAYGNKVATIINYPDSNFPVGPVIFTQTGQKIANLIDTKIVDKHFDIIIEDLKKKGVVFSDSPQIEIIYIDKENYTLEYKLNTSQDRC
ncbi:MAG: DUF2806 domain-containing protein [Defluviitaleaceae bacterium]|nr:DUF2806 domain-containing protein [Defluviitaleaceae bacterium]